MSTLTPTPAEKQWRFVEKDGRALLVIDDGTGADPRYPTPDEAHQAVSYLNDQGSNIVTLYCRTDGCPGKGNWVKRSAEDAKKQAISCESGCQKPMVR